MNPRPLHQRCIALLTLIVFAGCATTTVDVDVYKGPLANHEDVQLQQMAVMAVGAKPLLNELHGQLKDWPKQQGRVREIISLYEDIGISPEMEDYLNRVKRAQSKYNRAWDILNPKSDDLARASWDKFQANKKYTAKITGDEEKINTLLDDLMETYCQFYVVEQENNKPKFRKWKPIFATHKKLWVAGNLKSSKDFHVTPDIAPSKLPSKDDPVNNSSNDALAILASGELLKHHAALLFDDNLDEQKRFIAEMQRIANAFLETREQTEVLFLLCLEALSFSEDLNFKNSFEREYFISDLASAIWLLSKQLSMWIALEDMPSNSDAKIILEELRKYNPDIDVEYWDFMTPDKFQRGLAAFKHVAIEEPKVMSDALKAAHFNFKKSDDPAKGYNLIRTTPEEYSNPYRRVYGMTTGPGRKGGDLSPTILTEKMRNVLFTLKEGAFARGRGPEGLYTLIDNYLFFLDESYTDEELGLKPPESKNIMERNIAERRLRDSLIRFADKVLRLADNDGLLRDQEIERDDQQLSASTQKNQGSSKSSHKSSHNYSHQSSHAATGKSRSGKFPLHERYTMVLQSIGNSILVQANEHRSREAHEAKINRNYDRERLGVELAYLSDPSSTLDDIVAFMDASSRKNLISQKVYEADIKKKEKAKNALSGKDANGQALNPLPDTTIPAIEARIKAMKVTQTAAETAKIAVDTARTHVVWFPLPTAIPVSPATATGMDKRRGEFHALLKANFTAPAKKEGSDDAASDAEEKKAPSDLQKIIDRWFMNSIIAPNLGAKDVNALQKLNTVFDVAHAAENFSGVIEPSKYLTRIANQMTATLQVAVVAHAAISKVEDLEKEEANLKSAKTKDTTLEAEIKKLKSDKVEGKKLVDSIDQVKAHRAKVLSVTDASETPISGRGVVRELRKALRATLATTTDSTKEKALNHALILLAQYPASSVAPIINDDNTESAKDVLDSVIALLRQEHLKISRLEGPNSKHAQEIKATLDEAYDHRSGMVYIRQASSYLRSSYASTAFQRNPGIGWENLLGQQGVRSIPFFGAEIHNNARGFGKDRLKLAADIDKQYWQNINHVRVSGAGNTNYVIAKDDIGNWYVKNYSADPEPIIRGAESLAAFAMGGALQTDMVSQLQELRGEGAGASGTTSSASVSPLVKVLAKYESEYSQETNRTLESLLDRFNNTGSDTAYTNSMAAAIESQWESDAAIANKMEPLQQQLTLAATSQMKDVHQKLEAAHTNTTDAKDEISDIKLKIKNGPKQDMLASLELMEKDLSNPKQNIPLLDSIEQKYEVSKSAELQKDFDALRNALGSDEQGQIIADGLQALRRFHNLLVASVATVDFDSEAKGALDAEKAVLAALETDIAEATAVRDQAEVDRDNAEGDAKVPFQTKVEQQDAIIAEKTASKTTSEGKIPGLQSTYEAAVKAKPNAQNIVTNLVKAEINKFIEIRETAISVHEDRLAFVGEAASQ